MKKELWIEETIKLTFKIHLLENSEPLSDEELTIIKRRVMSNNKFLDHSPRYFITHFDGHPTTGFYGYVEECSKKYFAIKEGEE